MSNMNKTAQKLASLGRNGDDYLVHMSEEELMALDSIAPDGLTINPETGLPEAFSIKDVLPAVVGIGATMMGVPPIWAAALNAGTGLAMGQDPLATIGSGALSYGLGSAFDVGSKAAESATNLGLEQTAQAGADLAAQTGANFPLDFDAMGGAATWGPKGYEAVLAQPEEALGAVGNYLTTKEGLMHAAAPAALGLAGMYAANNEGAVDQPEDFSVDNSQKYRAAPLS